MSIKITNPISFCILFILIQLQLAAQDPFTTKPTLYDQSEVDSLGLITAEGTETFTVFAPNDTTNQFSNGAVLTAFKDVLYCQWQSSATDEDAEDTYVAYSMSMDGENWSEPMILAPSIDDGYCSSGGWWATEDTLVAYINTWPNSVNPRGGYTRYMTSGDGINWSDIHVLPMADKDTLTGIFEQDPHALPNGRIINSAHFQTGIILNPIYTDDPLGISGWTKAEFENMPNTGAVSREIEPSWYLRKDNTLVHIFRDQNSSFKKLASISTDNGESWTTPVLTDMPDARTKQSAGNFADGTAYLVGNPNNDKLRIPLAVTLSKDGAYFDQAYVLRKGGDDIQDQRFEGKAKRPGYHYPKSYVWNDHLYVSYTTNKEDVEITRVPIANLEFIPDNTQQSFIDPQLIELYKISTNEVKVKVNTIQDNAKVSVFSVDGQLIKTQNLVDGESIIDFSNLSTSNYVIQINTQNKTGAKIFNFVR